MREDAARGQSGVTLREASPEVAPLLQLQYAAYAVEAALIGDDRLPRFTRAGRICCERGCADSSSTTSVVVWSERSASVCGAERLTSIDWSSPRPCIGGASGGALSLAFSFWAIT